MASEEFKIKILGTRSSYENALLTDETFRDNVLEKIDLQVRVALGEKPQITKQSLLESPLTLFD